MTMCPGTRGIQSRGISFTTNTWAGRCTKATRKTGSLSLKSRVMPTPGRYWPGARWGTSVTGSNRPNGASGLKFPSDFSNNQTPRTLRKAGVLEYFSFSHQRSRKAAPVMKQHESEDHIVLLADPIIFQKSIIIRGWDQRII